jgi:hypothetical protein
VGGNAVAGKEIIDRRGDDADDDRRQFIARFGKLALVAAPTVAVLVTSMNSRAIAASCGKMCPPGTICKDDGECHCINPPC